VTRYGPVGSLAVRYTGSQDNDNPPGACAQTSTIQLVGIQHFKQWRLFSGAYVNYDHLKSWIQI